ncbi:MAG: dihydrodipicolinate synthase family protein [Dongiaceae bacterium]
MAETSSFQARKQRLEGCYITIPTMFSDPDLEIDTRATCKVVRAILNRGMDSAHGTFLVGGAAGDFSTLSFDERLRLVDAVLEEVNGTMPIAVGGQSTSTREAVAIAKAARRAGAEFLQISCPFYFGHTEGDFQEHITAVAAASDIGLIIYNTFWTSSNLSYALVDRLAAIPNVVGLKWATGRSDSMEFEEVVAHFSERFCIIDNQLKFVISHMLGARAYEVHTCNYWPEWGVQLVDDLNNGRYEKVQRALVKNVLPFYRLWREIESEFTSGDGYLDKLCMELVGMPSSRCRPPTRDIREKYRERARAMLVESEVPHVINIQGNNRARISKQQHLR